MENSFDLIKYANKLLNQAATVAAIKNETHPKPLEALANLSWHGAEKRVKNLTAMHIGARVDLKYQDVDYVILCIPKSKFEEGVLAFHEKRN